ncbi:hypothetical protein [Nitrosopumilus sp.]|uniref:hypothetical protein n=1 Tax=Nitrosopumilus sp. TaxID=2024843 RepID=UPI00247C8AE7|nr:hypothetical protein [Nitrosopumilus sp.]MCV0409265.1 hypothetical protein [Nitrosopumilus sp.]
MKDKISQVLMKTKLKKIAGVLAHFSSDHFTAKPEAFCALGLLYYNTGNMSSKNSWEELDVRGDFEFLKENYGITREQFRKLYNCPACDKSEFGLNEFLIHLSDYHDPKTRLEGVVPFTFKEIGQILEKEGL